LSIVMLTARCDTQSISKKKKKKKKKGEGRHTRERVADNDIEGATENTIGEGQATIDERLDDRARGARQWGHQRLDAVERRLQGRRVGNGRAADQVQSGCVLHHVIRQHIGDRIL